MRFAIAITAAVLLLAGCGGSKEPGGSPPVAVAPTTVTVTPTPIQTPTPSATASTPATLTREQAGKLYLAITKPVNAVFEKPECRDNEEVFLSGGTWPSDHPDRVVRACYKRMLPLAERWLVLLQTTPWPADAKGDVADLISLEQARLHCVKQGTRATTYDAMAEIYSNCFPQDDGSADRVRARFGLPIRTP
ncbi:hypothetical protein [Kribbella soli]|uniref:Uncharacterized protein n=1 Tax=Kribbella soli TaxID=1124743 RepID=A0A4R0GTS7_9ACTN|nr:hypothetical protein [Kribbella soli]TCC01325.1 hypothetical protein E0H45_42150 [Kribbella soli]